MSGLIVHRETMEKMNGWLKKFMPIYWTVGSYSDNIEADRIGRSHGAIVQKNNFSIIDDHILPTVNSLVEAFKRHSGYAVLVRRICHYCEDSFTIGQICGGSKDGGFWGSMDNKIDLASEFVRGKKDWHYGDTMIEDLDNIVRVHKDRMLDCYHIFYKDAKRWGEIVTPREVTNMVRFAVCFGSRQAAMYVYYAYRAAGSPKLKKPTWYSKLADRVFKGKKPNIYRRKKLWWG